MDAIRLNNEYSNDFLSIVKATIVNNKDIISLDQLADIIITLKDYFTQIM